MLSENVAIVLSWVSFITAGISIAYLFVLYEVYDYRETKIDKIARQFTWGLAITSIVIVMYSLVSLFINYDIKTEKEFHQSIKDKYSVTLTAEQENELYELIKELDEDSQILYATGSTKIGDREIIAIWRDKELFLMEFKNGSLVEIAERR